MHAEVMDRHCPPKHAQTVTFSGQKNLAYLRTAFRVWNAQLATVAMGSTTKRYVRETLAQIESALACAERH